MFELTDRKAVVTGAGRGLGRAMSLALAQAGADIAAVDIDDTAARNVTEEIRAIGRCSLVIKADVSDPIQVDSIAERVVKEWEHIDILVNNAGIGGRKPILETSVDEFEKVYQVNLRSVFLCSRRIAQEMIPLKYGKIINIASLASKRIIKHFFMSQYYATKAGVAQFTKAAAVEWAKYGIRVNAISPGFFYTEMSTKVWTEHGESMLDSIPLGRGAQPEELAGTVIFLASSASDYITGQNLSVDGGVSTW
jgi:NAD(P)-dependent dehydrogenase (short-subunit alcohol dehydrogenase family)